MKKVGFNEKLIGEKIHKTGLPSATIGIVSNISARKISEAARGINPFNGPDFHKINSVLDELLELQNLGKPYALPEDTTVLSAMLDDLRATKQRVPADDWKFVAKLCAAKSAATLAIELEITESELVEKITGVMTKLQSVADELSADHAKSDTAS
jgi:hypothetical protein